MVAASLQQHEDVLPFEVDLGIQGALDIYDWSGTGEGRWRVWIRVGLIFSSCTFPDLPGLRRTLGG